ncbi:ribonuclease H-like domain-containing protein [Lyophyllum atratum]|nr:ribonuclease H-like domain-containing protein [Lyophyllum atratum]
MAQALREPITLVSRYIRPSLLSRITHPNRLERHHSTTMSSSKVLAALHTFASRKALSEDDSDSDIEVVGPFPVQQDRKSKNKGKETSTRPSAEPDVALQPLHPLFLQQHRGHDRDVQLPNDKLSSRHSESEHRLPSPNIANGNCTIPTASAAMKAPPASRTTTSTTTKTAAAVAPRPMVPRPLKTQAVPDLPIYSYKDYTNPKPYLVYTVDESEADDLVDGLKAGPMALDMEWRVFFVRRGGGGASGGGSKVLERRTAVMQVADGRGLMLVVQVYGMDRFPKKLQALIENPDIPKLGVNILNDGRKLFRDYGILAKNLVELGALAAVADPTSGIKRKIISLAKLTERYCSKTLEKGNERTGNWEAPLDQRQLEYAANDTHSSLMIYQRLLALAEEHGTPLSLESDSTTFGADVEPAFTSPPVSRTSSTASASSATSGSGSTSASASSSVSQQGRGDAQDRGENEEKEKPEMRPQYLRAYRYWHERDMPMERMCLELSLKGRVAGVLGVAGEGLKVGTVITYIVSALQADPTLPFDMRKLRELVQMDAVSWVRHRDWILNVWADRLGVQAQAKAKAGNGDGDGHQGR